MCPKTKIQVPIHAVPSHTKSNWCRYFPATTHVQSTSWQRCKRQRTAQLWDKNQVRWKLYVQIKSSDKPLKVYKPIPSYLSQARWIERVQRYEKQSYMWHEDFISRAEDRRRAASTNPSPLWSNIHSSLQRLKFTLQLDALILSLSAALLITQILCSVHWFLSQWVYLY